MRVREYQHSSERGESRAYEKVKKHLEKALECLEEECEEYDDLEEDDEEPEHDRRMISRRRR